jgi:hypothetical protein
LAVTSTLTVLKATVDPVAPVVIFLPMICPFYQAVDVSMP